MQCITVRTVPEEYLDSYKWRAFVNFSLNTKMWTMAGHIETSFIIMCPDIESTTSIIKRS
jgi:hypothetical protein